MHRTVHALVCAALVSLGASACPSLAADVRIAAAHLSGDQVLRAQWFTPPPARSSGAAAILLHGCGGLGRDGTLNARHAAARDWLLERGIAVLFPESFTSRGVDEICTIRMKERTIRPDDRALDVMAAHRWLRHQPGIDAGKVVLWGWSHGGSTVLATVTHAKPDGKFDEDVRFIEAIAFYPGCSPYARDTAPASISSPLTVLIGEADDWTPAAPCSAFVERLRKAGQSATITLFADAWHDFDNPAGRLRVRRDVPNGVHAGGVTVGPNPKARAEAMAQIDRLLHARHLVRGQSAAD